MKDIKIVIVGGGSKLWSRSFAPDFCLHSSLSGTIILHDVSQDAASEAQALYQLYNGMGGDRWNIEATTSLDEALAGADFVLLTINHGGLKGTEIDLVIPEKQYGIPQTVGDTTGPGGLSRALRNIPAIVDIATAMQKHCPSAWLINLSNPMTVMCMAAAQHFDPSRVIGYCHEWILLRDYLRKVLHLNEGVSLEPFIFGVNHFSAIWDLYSEPPAVSMNAALRSILEKQEPISDAEYLVMSPFVNNRIVMREIARTCGVIPIAGDRHLVEFMPGEWLTPKELRKYGVKITTYDYREAQAKTQAEQYRQMLQGKVELPQEHSPEEIDVIIAALVGATKGYTTNVVVNGKTAIQTLMPFDPNCFYEATCHISHRNGKPNVELATNVFRAVSTPVTLGDFRYLTRLHAEFCGLVVHGILDGDGKLLAHALDLDPLTQQWIRPDRTIPSLAKELIARNAQLTNHPLLKKLL